MISSIFDDGVSSLCRRAETLTGRPMWSAEQVIRFFPVAPKVVYGALQNAGFDPELYRRSWPDLQQSLPTNDLAFQHFLQFLEEEVILIRNFPITIDFGGLETASRLRLRLRWIGSIVRNLVQAQIDYRPDLTASPEFWARVLAIVTRIGLPVVTFGDSHSRIYRQTVVHGSRVVIPLNILCGGGSATGLPRAESRSGYGRRIAATLEAINSASRSAKQLPVLLFAFGQVDLEFVLSFRRLQASRLAYDPADARSFSSVTASNYVQWLKSFRINNMYVAGINPPCLDDVYVREGYFAQMQTYNALSGADHFAQLEIPDKLERTALHRHFNNEVKAAAEASSMMFVSAFEQMIDQKTGEVQRMLCQAAANGKLAIGESGKDIHVGGKHALSIKSDLLRRLSALAVER